MLKLHMAGVTLSDLSDPLKVNSIGELFGRVLGVLLPLVGMLFVGLFIYGGVKYIMSAGDPSSIKQAQGILTSAVIGLAIVVFAFVIKAFISNALGTNL